MSSKTLNSLEFAKGEDSFLQDLSYSKDISNRQLKMVSIFGGSRVPEDSEYFLAAKNLASILSKSGISIITGGGPGIMKAGNIGAKSDDPSVFSLALNVSSIKDEIAEGSHFNVDEGCRYIFNTLSIRLLTLISSSRAIVFFPGGFGTLEETFCLLVRIRLRMMNQIPVYFYGSRFWGGLKDWLSSQVLFHNLIDRWDVDLMQIEDDIDKIAREIISRI